MVAAVGVLVTASPAHAHARLEASVPADGALLTAPPTAITLRFDDRMIPGLGSAVLDRPEGPPTALEPLTQGESVVVDLPSDLTDADYALTYHLVSTDGHEVDGTITFTVAAAPSSPPAAPSSPPGSAPGTGPGRSSAGAPRPAAIVGPALTGLQYISLMVMTGLLMCRVVVARGGAAGEVLASRAAVRSTRGLAAVAVLASAALMVATAIDVAGWSRWTAGIIPPLLLGTLFVTVSALVVVVAGGARRPGPALAGALLGMIAPVLVGHSVSVGPRALMLAADLGHLLAGAFWSGGLIGTVVVVATLRRSDIAGEAVAVIRRFSSAALVSVLVLAVSGVVMAVLILDSPAALVTTGWGRALSVKLIVVIAAVGMAAWNRTRLLPTIAASDAPWADLLRVMRREAVLLLVVLAVTGVLVNLSPHAARAEGEPGAPPIRADHQVSVAVATPAVR